MPTNFLSGKVAGVVVGSTNYAFSKWSLVINTKLIPVTPFVTGANQGFQRTVAGFTKGSLTMSGAYDVGNMPLSSGSSYSVTLQWTNLISITATVVVGEIKPTVDADGVDQLEVTGEMDGAFTISVT